MKVTKVVYVIEHIGAGLLCSEAGKKCHAWNKGYSSERLPTYYDDPTAAFDVYESLSHMYPEKLRVRKATITIETSVKNEKAT